MPRIIVQRKLPPALCLVWSASLLHRCGLPLAHDGPHRCRQPHCHALYDATAAGPARPPGWDTRYPEVGW